MQQTPNRNNNCLGCPPRKIFGTILEVDQRRILTKNKKKLMTVYNTFHPKRDVDILYVSRKDGGRGLASIEDSVGAFETTTWRKRGEDWLQPPDNMSIDRTETIRKRLWKEQLYVRFKRLASDIPHEKTWMWVRKGNFKRETVFLLKQHHKNLLHQSENV